MDTGPATSMSSAVTGSPDAVDDDARERGPHVGTLQEVVDLANPDLDDVRIAQRQVAVRLRLFEFELRDEARARQFLLAPQLALQLADVDPGAFEERFLLRALQSQAALVDARDVIALVDDGARLSPIELPIERE